MVEPTETNVEGPPVAAQNPHALAHQRIGHCLQVLCIRRIVARELLPQCNHALPLLIDLRLGLLRRVKNLRH